MFATSVIRRSRAPQVLAGLVALAVATVSCGTGADVPIPGEVAPPAAIETTPERAVFVEVDTSDEILSTGELPAEAAEQSVDLEASAPSATTSLVAESTVEAGSDTSATPTVVATPVVPVVSGWAAFDLHLMTILADGSDAVSATVLRDGQVVHEVALGNRTSAGDSVRAGDRYRVASISKTITAITVLQLVESGLVGLDEIVGPRLAARVGASTPAVGVESITVRHLLSHRSGIGQYENLMFRREVESCPEAGAVGLSRGLERAPGTTWRYSNLNFCLLGLLIEEVTGDDYESVVARELLDPLDIIGMRLADTFDVSDGDVEHDSDTGRNYMEVLDGAGSWIASPTDIVTIIDSLDLSTPGWKPLGPLAHAEMMTITVDPPAPPDPITDAATTTTTTIAPPPPTRGYGMGLMIFGDDTFGHTGTLESTSAMTVRQPDGLTWAITVSGDSPGSGRNLAPIVAAAFGYALID